MHGTFTTYSHQSRGRHTAPAANRSQVVLQSRRKFGKCPGSGFFRRSPDRSIEIKRYPYCDLITDYDSLSPWNKLCPYDQFHGSLKNHVLILVSHVRAGVDHCASQFVWSIMKKMLENSFFCVCVDRSWLIHFQRCAVLIHGCCNGCSGSWAWPELALSTSGAQQGTHLKPIRTIVYIIDSCSIVTCLDCEFWYQEGQDLRDISQTCFLQ